MKVHVPRLALPHRASQTRSLLIIQTLVQRFDRQREFDHLEPVNRTPEHILTELNQPIRVLQLHLATR
jgi:hypothetical protein